VDEDGDFESHIRLIPARILNSYPEPVLHVLGHGASCDNEMWRVDYSSVGGIQHTYTDMDALSARAPPVPEWRRGDTKGAGGCASFTPGASLVAHFPSCPSFATCGAWLRYLHRRALCEAAAMAGSNARDESPAFTIPGNDVSLPRGSFRVLSPRVWKARQTPI
jgi:hypothetical protein